MLEFDQANRRQYRMGGRLALDDALKQMRDNKVDLEKAFEGWSQARIRAYQMIDQNPNSYYYRFNAPGEEQRKGQWTEEEKVVFHKRLEEVGANGQWGIFSMSIPGRVGYQVTHKLLTNLIISHLENGPSLNVPLYSAPTFTDSWLRQSKLLIPTTSWMKRAKHTTFSTKRTRMVRWKRRSALIVSMVAGLNHLGQGQREHEQLLCLQRKRSSKRENAEATAGIAMMMMTLMPLRTITTNLVRLP
jgi:hypothetical protein